MPEEIDNFLDALSYYNADEAVSSNLEVQSMINSARRLGLDILDTFQNWFNKPDSAPQQSDDKIKQAPPPPPSLVRSLSETAYLEPKSITPLDEVTKPELKEYSTLSQVFKGMSYGVKDFSVTAVYKDKEHDSRYMLRVGDKMGFQYQHKSSNGTTYQAGIEQNVFSGRTRLNGTIQNPRSSISLSIYQKHGDFGTTISYSNQSGFVASASTDFKGAAVSAGYTHNYSDCRLSIRGFISTQYQGIDTFNTRNYSALVGVCGTITM